MTERKTIDWERLEADYRAGLLSLREIASVHGITEGAIRKRAKRDDWARNLTAKVQAKADELVRRELVRTSESTQTVRKEGDPYSEREIVAAGGEILAGIQISHRKDIARFRKIAIALLEELEVETENRELFDELGVLLRSENDKGVDKLNDLYHKVISSAGRVASVKQLAETLKILIGLEREAYGLSNDTEKEKAIDNLATALEAARKRVAG